jgi:sterol 14-demethylase
VADVISEPVAAARRLRKPPMLKGLPLVGNLPDFLKHQDAMFHRGYAEHGPIFGVRIGPQRGVALVGPRYSEMFFREVDNKLSIPELYKFVIPMFGEVIMSARDGETRRRHVRLLQSAFQGRRLSRYMDDMRAETTAWLDSLGDSGEFEVWSALEPLSMRVAATALMGPEVRARIDEFRPLLVDLARGMEFVLPPNLPLPKFRRRDRARRLLTEMIRPVLAERRAHPGRDHDFLQTLVDDPSLRSAEGEDDAALVGMALGTIFTGYITTAAQMSWALVKLLEHPGYARTVVTEIDTARASGEPTWRTRLSRLDWAVREAVRLRPVMSHYARLNTVDYEVDGYLLPKGWLTIICPSVAHRLPEVFTDPEAYDPERFSPERAEDHRHPYAMIGFSGGFYRCPGSAFGMGEMNVVIGMLLERFDLALATPSPATDFDLGIIRPAPPCVIRYRRRPAA